MLAVASSRVWSEVETRGSIGLMREKIDHFLSKREYALPDIDQREKPGRSRCEATSANSKSSICPQDDIFATQHQARTHLPKNGRIALLIRGQAFRAGKTPCVKEKYDHQLNTTSLLVSNVVRPLEEMGNKVDIIAADDRHCSMMRDIRNLLGSHKILANPDISIAENQGISIRLLLEGFKSAVGGIESARQYDLIFVTRHDLEWKTHLYKTTADYSNLNFASRCEVECAHGCEIYGCVNDVAEVMPGMLFPVFDSVVGADRCWNERGGWQCDCHHATVEFTDAFQNLTKKPEIGFLVGWRPERGTHEPNPYFEIMS